MENAAYGRKAWAVSTTKDPAGYYRASRSWFSGEVTIASNPNWAFGAGDRGLRG